MTLCSNEHEEVCYETRTCPMCELITDYEAQIEDLEKQLEETRNE